MSLIPKKSEVTPLKVLSKVRKNFTGSLLGRTSEKEIYFTSDTLDYESEKMLEEINCNQENSLFKSDINYCTLLVLDMQEFFLNPASHAFVPSAPHLINRINALIYTFRRKNLPVVFTKHINTSENAGQMKSHWKDLITINNPLSSIASEVSIEDSTVIVKSQYDAFYNTDLESILKMAGCKSIIICGLMTHLCCETTARSAFVRGFEVIMPVDGTASYNRMFHLSSIYNLSHGFAYITRIKEILNWCEKN